MTPNKQYLEIDIPGAEEADVGELLSQQNIAYKTRVSLSLDSSDIITLAVELAPAVLTFLAGLYVARVNSKKHVVYKYGGVEIKGVSEQQLTKMLEKQLLPGVTVDKLSGHDENDSSENDSSKIDSSKIDSPEIKSSVTRNKQ